MAAPDPSLPLDATSILALAAREMFALFSDVSQGMLLVDRGGRVVWINEGYRRFLPHLGFTREADFVGQPVEAVIPNTLMHEVLRTGRPVLVDLLTNRAGTFVVSRLPLRDAHGQVIGALGMVLFDQAQAALQPLIHKFVSLQSALDTARHELAQQRRAKYTLASYVGHSPAVQELKRQARRAAYNHSPVLLLGETGTGKELIAHAIHSAGPRAHKPLVTVNIAAVPDALLEAEFFGVAPGAYTGADRKGRDGKLMLADGGTLLLDEIGDMPLALQAKLLRVLQEQEFEPLGSNRLVKVDVRVLAATSHDLPARVAAGQFRADLYYRLNVITLRLPALRERPQDIAALVEVLGEDIARRSGVPQKEWSPQALALLTQQPWPGNVRELRNLIEQLNLLTDASRIEEADLRGRVLAAAAPKALESVGTPLPRPPTESLAPPDGPTQTIAQRRAAVERAAIAQALATHHGNKSAAARSLGMARATLYQRLAADPSLVIDQK
jgi:transcriptional regulator with PAS, ATPase and Fis domain